MPARSRRLATSSKPAAWSRPRTASAWSQPCSIHNAPPGERAPAPCAMRARSPSPSAPSVSAARLEAHVALSQVRIVAGHVGRVGDDQLEALAGRHGVEPAAFDKAHRGRQFPGVAGGHGQRGRTQVAGHHARVAPGQRDRDRDRAAAGAQVQHRRRGLAFQALQRGFDQHLGVRTRNQHVGRDAEKMAHEFAAADQIGHRLARQPAPGQVLISLLRGGRQRIGVMRQQPGARLLQHVLQQHAHFQARQPGIGEQGLDLGHRAPPWLRRRRPAPPAARPGVRRSARRSVLPGRLP